MNIYKKNRNATPMGDYYFQDQKTLKSVGLKLKNVRRVKSDFGKVVETWYGTKQAFNKANNLGYGYDFTNVKTRKSTINKMKNKKGK